MRIIAVDDEPLALEALLSAIEEAAPDADVSGFSAAADALAAAAERHFDAAFLDIEMGGTNGIRLAETLTAQSPDINIIFTTGYDRYLQKAFQLHASGYLRKPITAHKIRQELDQLRHPVHAAKRIRIQTFGNFEVYLDGDPLTFQYSKTKELLAYLVDRCGALCTNGEISAVLFEDGSGHSNYLRSLRKDLVDVLERSGCEHVLRQQRGQMGIVPEAVDCDYYDWNAGKPGAAAYRGEYMLQYSWAEETAGALERLL